MKHRSNKKTIEEFISYKLDCPAESESACRAFLIQKGCQKNLDTTAGLIEAKHREVESLTLKHKMVKEEVWQKTLAISRAVKLYEDESYAYASKARGITEDRAARVRSLQQRQEQIAARESELVQHITTTLEESEFYFAEKNRQILEQRQQNEAIVEKILSEEPGVQKYYAAISSKESLLGGIADARRNIQNCVRTAWELSEQHEALQSAKRDRMKERELLEAEETQTRSQEINLFIAQVNQCAASATFGQEQELIGNAIRQKKKKLEAMSEEDCGFAAGEFEKSEKFKAIASIIAVPGSSMAVPGSIIAVPGSSIAVPGSEDPCISPTRKGGTAPAMLRVDADLEPLFQEKLHELGNELNELEDRMSKMLKEESDLQARDREQDEEMESLAATLQKMSKSLAGK